MATTNCKDCAAPIGFIKGENGRWRPVEAGTETFHRCRLVQICEGCQSHFDGSPWMKLCKACFSNNRPNRAGFRQPEAGNFGQAETRRTPAKDQRRREHIADEASRREEVDSNFDDIPF